MSNDNNSFSFPIVSSESMEKVCAWTMESMSTCNLSSRVLVAIVAQAGGLMYVWSPHRQIVYTNVPEMVWREAGLNHYEIVPYEPPPSSHNYDISPQCLKDLWQFMMPEYHDGAWCADWERGWAVDGGR